jgi:hypothetical protein
MMDLVKTLAITAGAREGVVVRIYRDAARGAFFPVVFRRTYCRVGPAFVKTVADEEIEIVDPSFAAQRFVHASARRVLDEVVAALRGAKTSFGLAELVQAVEIGPFECPGEAPWYFSVRIYKDLGRARRFYPVVYRREFYRMTASFAKTAADEQVDVVDSSFEAEAFVRTSATSARVAILRHIRGLFDPGVRPRKVRA